MELLGSRYEILESRGRGGRGNLLRALDRQHGRIVALKTIPIDESTDRQALLGEADVLLRLRSHPGLPVLRDDFFVDDRYVLVLDWVDGVDVGTLLDEQGDPGLPWPAVIDVLAQVATILDHCHHHDPPVFHGDVKPSNLIRTPAGTVVLVDFGVSSAGTSRVSAGTRGYVAPEVVAGAPLSAEADVYGFAATAATLVTGQPPSLMAPTWEGIDPEVVGPLARVLRRGLALDPARRPSSAGDLVERLRVSRDAALPRGTVTFVGVEIADAAQQWASDPEAMDRACDDLGHVLSEIVERHAGHVVSRIEDGERTLAAFTHAAGASAAGVDIHEAVRDRAWPGGVAISVRVGVHTGHAELRDGAYRGPAAHAVARLRTVAPVGRTLISTSTAELLAAEADPAVVATFLGDLVGIGPAFSLDRAGQPVAPAVLDPLATPAQVVLVCADVRESGRPLVGDEQRSAGARVLRTLGRLTVGLQGSVLSTTDDRIIAVFTEARVGTEFALVAAEAATRGRSAPEALPLRLAIDTVASPDPGALIDPAAAAATIALCQAANPGQVLLSESARTALGTNLPTGAGLSDLGPHRLSDLGSTQHVCQLVHADLPSDFPPLRTLDRRPNNLPVQLTTFIGRGSDVEELQELLDDHRLVTVLGSGGVGKTRVALQVGASRLGAQPDGVWFVDLSTVPDDDLVVAAVAAALDASDGGSATFAAPGPRTPRSATDRLIDHLEFRDLLLVLDNCEHLLAAVVPLVEIVLARCPGIVVLTTTHEPLGVVGEVVRRLEPLTLPPVDAPLDVVEQCSAVRLFMDRARLRPIATSSSTRSPRRRFAAICRSVDGVPFAIELAAAQVGMLALPQIVAMLDDQLGALGPAPRGAPPRRATLRAMIEWSFDLLTDQEQQLLLPLSVFVGGFTLEAARFVGTGGGQTDDDVSAVLAGLLDKCLVELDAGDDEHHFRLLEVTRQYAAHRLDDLGGRAGAVRTHRRWFTDLAERAGEGLTGADQATWLRVIDADYENLLAALSDDRVAGDVGSDAGPATNDMDGADDRDDAGAEQRIAGCLALYWLVRGRLSEGRDILAETLERPCPRDGGVRGRALFAVALLGAFGGWFDEAQDAARKAIEIGGAEGDQAMIAHASTVLGLVESGTGSARDAERHHRRAAVCARAGQDPWAESFALTNLGNVLARRGATAEAEAAYQESVDIRRVRGDDWGLSWALFRLGSLHLWQGRLDEADDLVAEAHARAERLNYRQGTLLAQLAGGEIAYARGATRDARARFEMSLATARDMEAPSIGCMALAGLANVALVDGRIEEGVRWLSEEDLLRPGLTMASLAALASAQAEVAAVLGHLDVSEAGHRDALEVRWGLDDRRGAIAGLEDLASSAARMDGLERAAFLLAAAARGRQDMGGPVPPVRRTRLEQLAERFAADKGEAVQAAWQGGLRATLEDAVAVALD